MSRKRKSPLPIQPAMCGSCIFREDGKQVELAPGRLNAIRAYTIQGIPHICHHPQITGQKKTLACRGARDYLLTIWHRMGLIDAPTDEALEQARLKHTTAKEIP